MLILGLLAGIILTFETGINEQLRKRVGSPYYASFISFVVALFFLVVLLLVTGTGCTIPFDLIGGEPFWIWLGGICGSIFLTGNILLLANLDGVQTVILPAFGQIIMGVVIDTFGLFNATVVNLTVLRIIGAVLVAVGVSVVSFSKNNSSNQNKNNIKIWLWRIFGIIAGMLTALQAAFNGYLGKVISSPIKATLVSFITGTAFLFIVCAVVFLKNKGKGPEKVVHTKSSLWIWSGGILGGVYVLLNITLSGIIGVGTTVITILTGSTLGGLLVDNFGWFGCEVKPITVTKSIGIAVIIVAAALIKLF